MLFPTLEFAIFFVLVFSAYWLLRFSRTAQKVLLLLSSYLFYARIGYDIDYGEWSPRLLIVLVGSSLINWGFGEAIYRSPDGSKGRKFWTIAGTTFNLLLLVALVYYGFLQQSFLDLATMLGLSLDISLVEVVAPVGLSFYTFVAISYLIDIGRGTGVKARTLLDFLLYMAFFPKLLSGPITRASGLLAEIQGPCPPGIPNLTLAASLILSGLFKKVVLSHFIAVYLVMEPFSIPENFSSPALWVAMFGYAFQLYWDFSGYTDLALGLALLLGFSLPENFNHPYIATDVSDFWRRWHMSLSFWLRDYVFTPNASRWSKALAKRMPFKQAALWGSQLALLLTFFLTGLWHGADWKYVVWGMLHGVAQFIHHGLRAYKIRWNGGWAGRLGTFLLVSLFWVPFASTNLQQAWVFYKGMFSFTQPGEGFRLIVLPVLLLGMLLQIFGETLRKRFISGSEQLPLALRPVLWFAIGIAIMFLKPRGIAPYIYFNF